MKKIVILTCKKASRVCTGAACLKAFNQKTKTFEQYLDEPIELEAFFQCNGCDENGEGIWDEGMEEKVWNQICRFGLENRVILSSFHAQTLLRVKALAPEAPCGLLNQDKLLSPGQATRDLGLEAYHPLYLRLRPGVIRELKACHLEINAYTVNGHGPLTYLFAWDVHSVITNHPRRALTLRRLIQGNPGLTNPKIVVK